LPAGRETLIVHGFNESCNAKEEYDMTSFQPQFPEDEKHCGSCGANASFIDNEGVPLCKTDAIIAMTRDPHELATAVADLLERHQGVV
jgi:hypothetical protein